MITVTLSRKKRCRSSYFTLSA